MGGLLCLREFPSGNPCQALRLASGRILAVKPEPLIPTQGVNELHAVDPDCSHHLSSASLKLPVSTYRTLASCSESSGSGVPPTSARPEWQYAGCLHLGNQLRGAE